MLRNQTPPVHTPQKPPSPAGTRSHPGSNESALLRILVAEASRRGWTLTQLAHALGLTYERLAQYRRGDADIANAKRSTLTAAAELLGIPLAGVFVLAGKLVAEDFIWPGRGSLRERLSKELAALGADPFFAGFVDDELARAHVRVQYLVVLLYREAVPTTGRTQQLPQWLRTLQLASLENARALASDAGGEASPEGSQPS